MSQSLFRHLLMGDRFVFRHDFTARPGYGSGIVQQYMKVSPRGYVEVVEEGPERGLYHFQQRPATRSNIGTIDVEIIATSNPVEVCQDGNDFYEDHRHIWTGGACTGDDDLHGAETCRNDFRRRCDVWGFKVRFPGDPLTHQQVKVLIDRDRGRATYGTG